MTEEQAHIERRLKENLETRITIVETHLNFIKDELVEIKDGVNSLTSDLKIHVADETGEIKEWTKALNSIVNSNAMLSLNFSNMTKLFEEQTKILQQLTDKVGVIDKKVLVIETAGKSSWKTLSVISAILTSMILVAWELFSKFK